VFYNNYFRIIVTVILHSAVLNTALIPLRYFRTAGCTPFTGFIPRKGGTERSAGEGYHQPNRLFLEPGIYQAVHISRKLLYE